MTSFASITDLIGRALLHSVWEGAVIAMLFAIAMIALRKRSAQARYLTACIALLLMLLAPIATIMSHPAPPHVQREIVANVSIQPTPIVSALTPRDIAPIAVTPHRWALSMLQYATIVWAAGLLIVSLWQIAGWLTVRRFVRTAQPADVLLLDRLQRLCDRMRVRFPIALRVCEQLTTPALVGWLRPVILIPPAALCDLPVDYFESLLLHELAHVRRHDYLINLMQTIAETLLFYHPAAWWVSRVIRDERENCCDDETIRRADKNIYLRALAMMESLRADPVGSPALAATGGHLIRRIKRLAGGATPRSRFHGAGIGVVVLLGAIALVSASYAAQLTKSDEAKPAPSRPATSQPAESRGDFARDSIVPEDLQEPEPPKVIRRGDRIVVGPIITMPQMAFPSAAIGEDGILKIGFLGSSIDAVGMTPEELTKVITDEYRARGYKEPLKVYVTILPNPADEINYTVTGSRLGGKLKASNHTHLLEAVMDAKGKNEPRAQRIYVLRSDAEHGNAIRHIEIPVDKLLSGDVSCSIVLRENDAIVVEPGK